MLAHCLENLRAVPEIAAITVMAQQPEALLADAQVARAAESPKVRMLASRTGIASSIAAVGGSEIAWPILVTTADHPLLRPETISAFLAEARGCDLAVGVVERGVVRSAFPDNRRTWLHFREGSWTGANLLDRKSTRLNSSH